MKITCLMQRCGDADPHSEKAHTLAVSYETDNEAARRRAHASMAEVMREHRKTCPGPTHAIEELEPVEVTS